MCVSVFVGSGADTVALAGSDIVPLSFRSSPTKPSSATQTSLSLSGQVQGHRTEQETHKCFLMTSSAFTGSFLESRAGGGLIVLIAVKHPLPLFSRFSSWIAFFLYFHIVFISICVMRTLPTGCGRSHHALALYTRLWFFFFFGSQAGSIFRAKAE